MMKIIKSKTLALLLTLVVVFVNFCIGSYAWFTSGDAVVNRFKSEQLGVSIAEDFSPPENWGSGKKITKQVSVLNTASGNALVRVSLKEFLALFEVDVSTGNLATYPNSTPAFQIEQNPGTPDVYYPTSWRAGQMMKARYMDANREYQNLSIGGTVQYYKVKSVFPNPEPGPTDPVRFNVPIPYPSPYTPADDIRDENISDYITIHWTDNIVVFDSNDNAPVLGANDRWIYDQATRYFYYYKILEPGESTEPLIDFVETSIELPNSYKSGVYKLGVDAYGVTPIKGILENYWDLPTSGAPVYHILSELF